DELLRVQRQRRQHRQRLRRRLRCDVDQSAVSSFQLPDGLASLTSGFAITGRMRCGFEWARLPARPTETLAQPMGSPRPFPVYAITGRMRCGFEGARLPARPTKPSHYRELASLTSGLRDHRSDAVWFRIGAPSSATHEDP